jgi:protein-disulfide isomerase
MAKRHILWLALAISAITAATHASAEDRAPEPETFWQDRSKEPVDPKDLREAGPLGDTLIGKPGAPVTIIEYVSLACPICRVFHAKVLPRIKKEYIDTGKALYIYREFPIGKAAQGAAVAARCAPAKDYFRISERLMANQGKWAGREVVPDALYKLVQDTGLSRAEFDSCLANQPINDGIVWSKQRGRKIGVQGTPTFFVNDRKVRGMLSYEEMRDLIEQTLASAKPA